MNYRRLYETTSIQELTQIKFIFDDRRIRYRTLYENSLQLAQVGALGNQGAVIEVVDEDYDIAKDILRALGIQLDYHVKEDRFEIIQKIDNVTRSIPGINSLQLGYRVLLAISLTLVLLMIVVFLLVS